MGQIGEARFFKHACGRDKILHAIVVDKTDGGEATGGDLAAPTGRFTRLANAGSAPAELEERYPALFVGEGFDRQELVGHFIVTELADGFVFVGEFQKEHQAEDEFEQLERKYAKWQAKQPLYVEPDEVGDLAEGDFLAAYEPDDEDDDEVDDAEANPDGCDGGYDGFCGNDDCVSCNDDD